MKKSVMIMFLALTASATATADTVIKDNGEMVEAPDGYKVIFVPESTNIDRMYEIGLISSVDAKRPTVPAPSEARPCVPDGELSLGDNAC